MQPYWPFVIGTILLVAFQTAFIVVLLAQRRTRARVRSRLQQNEERFRLMVESMPNALLMINAKGSIVLANSRAEALFGYSRKELVGLRVEKLIPNRLLRRQGDAGGLFFQRTMRRTLGTGSDFFCVRKDGREVPVEIGINRIKTQEKEFVLASITDISERQKTEIEVERQRQQVAHLGRVEMLSHLSGSIAHEINQPLTAISNNSLVVKKLLQKPNGDGKMLMDVIDDIISDNRRAADIVVRLRGWLRKENQNLIENNVNSLIEEVAYFLKSELLFNKAVCNLQLQSSLPFVFCDKIQIQQVIVNLVKNAYEMPQSIAFDERQIEIRSGLRDDHILVSIQDNGDGISDAILKELFNPFITTKKGGLGMGLSISKSIVESHRGKIWAEKNEGRGMTFHFTIPLTQGRS